MLHPFDGDSDLRMVILVDNQVRDGLQAEHGFSLWIDTGGERILFDTGQGPALAHNALKLDIDWPRIDHLVLSHGHYDHTGGLQYAIAQSPQVHVHCHPGIVQPRYSIRPGHIRPIQIPSASATALDHVTEQCLHWVLRPTMISERVGFSGPIPRQSAYEDTGGPFFLDPYGKRPDPIEDDSALWIHTDRGLVVCLGCCHAGLINTLEYILHLNPGATIRAIIGGLHLLNAGDERLQRTAAFLQTLRPEKIVACHCTGGHALDLLVSRLGDRVLAGAAGEEYRW